MGLYDPDGTLLMMNNSAAAELGGAPADFIGKSIDDFIPENTKLYKKRIREVFESGKTENFEDRVRLAAEYRWYLSQYIPISNEKGEIYAVQICSVDITDRKKAEDHLDELQADLIALIENTEDIIVFRDIEGRVKIYNKACKEITRKLFDVEIEEGMRTTDYLPAEQRRYWEGILTRVSKGERIRKEFSFSFDDGDVRHYDISLNPIIKNGVIIGTSEFNRDITGFKKAEAALVESEKRYRSVVEDQTEIISRFTTDGTFTFVNETYCRFFGKSQNDLIGNQWHPVAYKEDLPRIDQQLNKMSVINPVVIIENRVWDCYGRLHWMQFVNHGFYDSQGKLYEIQSVGRDITSLKENERLLQEKELEIQQKTNELEKINNALEVLLDQRNRQINELYDNITRNFNKTIAPLLYELKKLVKSESTEKLVSFILHNFYNLLNPKTDHLTSVKYNLTKTELKIASMIRDDMTSIEIADQLNISLNTVGFHRKNMRKKLGIDKSRAVLSEFLKYNI